VSFAKSNYDDDDDDDEVSAFVRFHEKACVSCYSERLFLFYFIMERENGTSGISQGIRRGGTSQSVDLLQHILGE
jgi:hypothetical protein